jgi:hypothetical protein
MRPTKFLEQFHTQQTDDASFFYGMERHVPISSLLFMRHFPSSDYPSAAQNFSLPDVLPSDVHISVPRFSEEYGQTFCRLLFCAAEFHTRRISTTKFMCIFCSKPILHDEKLEHMITRHSLPFVAFLKNHFSFFNDDSIFMDGFFGKLEFDSLVAHPTIQYQLHRKPSMTICAPPITAVAESPSRSTNDFSFSLNGIFSPLFTELLKAHAPQPPRTPPPEPFDPSEPGSGLHSIDQLLSHFRPPPKPKIPVNPNMNLNMKQPPQPIRSPPPAPVSPPTPVSPPKPIMSPVRVIPEPEPAPAPEPIPKREPTPDPPKPKPKLVLTPFWETLPGEMRPIVLKTVCDRFLRSFAEGQCLQIVRPVIATRKKQHQKRVREERAQKAKEDEKLRVAAMRERRGIAILRMAEGVYNPLLRLFIRAEIDEIFREEEARRDEAMSLPEISNGDNKILRPVVVSGILHRKNHGIQMIRDLFAGYSFAMDEDGTQRIRFRSNGYRYDLLLYLASERDVNRLLAQRSVHIEYSVLKLALDPDDHQASAIQSYTGQNFLLVQGVKNMDDLIQSDTGKWFVQMMPVMCVDSFFNVK